MTVSSTRRSSTFMASRKVSTMHASHGIRLLLPRDTAFLMMALPRHMRCLPMLNGMRGTKATRGTQEFHRLLSKTWHRIGRHAPLVTLRIHPAVLQITILQSTSLGLIVRIWLLEPLWKERIASGIHPRPRLSPYLKSATLTPCDGHRQLRQIQMLPFIFRNLGQSGEVLDVRTCHHNTGLTTKLTQVLRQAPRTPSHFKCLIFGRLRVQATFLAASRYFSSTFTPKANAIVVRRVSSGFCRTPQELLKQFLYTSLPNTSSVVQMQVLGSNVQVAMLVAQVTFTSSFAPQVTIPSMKHGRGAI